MVKVKNDQQLAYLLQGFFEISGTNTLSAVQGKQVAKFIANMEQPGDLSRFVMNKLIECDFEGAGAAIAAKLEETFQHDIDPSYPGDQKEFNKLHGDRPDGPVLRC